MTIKKTGAKRQKQTTPLQRATVNQKKDYTQPFWGIKPKPFPGCGTEAMAYSSRYLPVFYLFSPSPQLYPQE